MGWGTLDRTFVGSEEELGPEDSKLVQEHVTGT